MGERKVPLPLPRLTVMSGALPKFLPAFTTRRSAWPSLLKSPWVGLKGTAPAVASWFGKIGSAVAGSDARMVRAASRQTVETHALGSLNLNSDSQKSAGAPSGRGLYDGCR